jgi:hypothetical protein
MLKENEPHKFGFPSCLISLSHRMEWTRPDPSYGVIVAFGELKPSNKPHYADYARLFMSAWLHCVEILIFETGFCVGIYNRDGVTFSSIFDMFEDTETLIRVVRSVGCSFSAEELGFDPTVHVLFLSDLETQKLAGNITSRYPSAVVSPCGNDLRQWYTIGPPRLFHFWALVPTSGLCVIRKIRTCEGTR